mmetsp:Transcript_55610/g.120059  ORF Transcript_55610/g.120059 Transcript_55610/m.120059 type:complete len:354 (+) Transcript_55610:370-1431(+)
MLPIQADEAAPGVDGGGLDGDACPAGVWQHALYVIMRLTPEELDAGHAHGAHLHALLRQSLVRLQHQSHLAACGHQDQVRLLGAEQGVAAVVQHGRLGVLLTVQRRQGLPRQDHGRRFVRELRHILPHLHHLVGVAWPEGQESRHCPESRQVLNGLMGGPVLSDADGIVREDEDARQLHDGGESDRRPHVVHKDQEGRAKGPEPGEGHSVHNGSHGVLSDAEVEVAAGVVSPTRAWGQHVSSALELERRQAGGGKVAGASNHPWHRFGQHVQALAGGLASCEALGASWEVLEELVPVLGQHAALHAVEHIAQLRVLLLVLHTHLLPGLPLHSASVCHLRAEVLDGILWHKEGL